MPEDETMSQDQAFSTENNKESVFNFDDLKSETADETKPDSSTSESKEEVVSSDEEESRVPYSRFKKKNDELMHVTENFNALEKRLHELEQSRIESASSKDDVEPDASWIKLYGDSDVAREAYKEQKRRDDAIEERALNRALEIIEKKKVEEETRLSENEDTIEESLQELSESIGKKFTPKQEEAILEIVDEFSPVGKDGKYVSLFPFEKAYEIYELRSSRKTNVTDRTRKDIASLTGGASEGDTDSSASTFKRGWGNWEDAIN